MEEIHHYHDKTYKLLFSHPKIIKDLLTGFIEEDFVKVRTEEIIEAEKILIEMVDFKSELGRFIKIWLGTYLKKHNIPFNIDMEGGSPMLATAIKNSIQEAKEEGKLDTVKKMLSKNYTVEEISEVTGLTLEEIKKIR